MSLKINISKIPIHFIVCKGRSGSTLLQSLLDAKEDVCAPIEAKFVLHLRTKYQHLKTWNKAEISNFIDEILKYRRYKLYWKNNRNDLEEHFNKFEIASFSDACKVVYLSYNSFFEKKTIKTIIDKNPFHGQFLFELKTIFPEAKVIFLIRDPRDNVVSHSKAFNEYNIPMIAYEWKQVNLAIEAFNYLNSKDVLPIKYEDMVTNTHEVVEHIFNFLSINFEKEVLNAHKIIKEKIDKNSFLRLKHHSKIANPINSNNVSIWKNRLSEKDIDIINYICKEGILKYNYEKKVKLKKWDLKTHFYILKGQFLANIRRVIFKKFYQGPLVIRKLTFNIFSLLFDTK